jgi:S1-C subfamily serine protease
MKKPITCVVAAMLAILPPVGGSAAFAQSFEQSVENGVGGFKELHPFGQAQTGPASVPHSAVPAGGNLAGSDQALVDLIARSMPSVVVVKTDDGLGTGFIIDPKGLVVTNAHVVEGVDIGDELNITTSDKKTHKAKLVAVGDQKRRDKDMAFLQISETKTWPALTFSDGQSAASGRFVVALGHPRGLEFTTTTGIISALGRHFDDSVLSFIQTNAAINPGNSGGPLLDLSGKVIGMDTQIVSESGGSEGLGFAITADEVVRGWDQFKRTGNLGTGYIGAALNFSKKKQGLAIETVVYAGPSQKAGLKAGDVILEIEGQTLPTDDAGEALRQALHAIAFKSAGETLSVSVKRAGQTVGATVTVGKWPAPSTAVMASLSPDALAIGDAPVDAVGL